MLTSTCGFVLGSTVAMQTYLQNGNNNGIKLYKVVEVRKMPTGVSRAIGELPNGKRHWLYAEHRAY